MYHDRFSTSSYFMPSLYFKAREVFAIEPDAQLAPHADRGRAAGDDEQQRSGAASPRPQGRSGGGVGRHQEKVRESHPELLFIQIPTPVPNDFLVASGIERPTERLILDAITKHPEADRACTDLVVPVRTVPIAGAEVRKPCEGEPNPPTDDFDSWYAWDSNDSEVTDSAREALAKLRQDARQRPTPVVVKVERVPKDRLPDQRMEDLLNAYVHAAREAVRLSGTEFVLEDRDLHKRADMTWTLESTHDGALKLTSRLDSAIRKIGRGVHDQLRRHQRSAAADRRSGPVAPAPHPLRVAVRAEVPGRAARPRLHAGSARHRAEDQLDGSGAQRIRGRYAVRGADREQHRLQQAAADRRDQVPQERRRLVQLRSAEQHRLSRGHRPRAAGRLDLGGPAYGFIGLFALACAGLAIDLRRRQPPAKGLQQTYQRMVEAYHRPWREQEIEEGQILWCDPAYMDEFVKELKTAGSFLDVVQAGGCDFNFGPLPMRFSILMKLGSQPVQATAAAVVGAGRVVGRQRGGARHADSVPRLPAPAVAVRRDCRRAAPTRSRSPAWPIEWEALNDIASRHFQRLGICDKRVEANLGTQHSVLSAVVSNHFRGVIKKATHDASLFCQTWTVRESETSAGLDFEGRDVDALLLRNQDGSATASRVRSRSACRRRALSGSAPDGDSCGPGCSARFSTGRWSTPPSRCTSSRLRF